MPVKDSINRAPPIHCATIDANKKIIILIAETNTTTLLL